MTGAPVLDAGERVEVTACDGFAASAASRSELLLRANPRGPASGVPRSAAPLPERQASPYPCAHRRPTPSRLRRGGPDRSVVSRHLAWDSRPAVAVSGRIVHPSRVGTIPPCWGNREGLLTAEKRLCRRPAIRHRDDADERHRPLWRGRFARDPMFRMYTRESRNSACKKRRETVNVHIPAANDDAHSLALQFGLHAACGGEAQAAGWLHDQLHA